MTKYVNSPLCQKTKDSVYFTNTENKCTKLSQQSGREQGKPLSSGGQKREHESNSSQSKEEGGQTFEILRPQWGFFENGQHNLAEDNIQRV